MGRKARGPYHHQRISRGEGAPDLLEEGIKRYCKHSKLQYEGMLWGRHTGYTQDFMDEEKEQQAAAFAEKLCGGDGEDTCDPELLCPCCGQYAFEEKGAYEICPVCGWEDDPYQRRNPDFAGGANTLSLNEARRYYHDDEK